MKYILNIVYLCLLCSFSLQAQSFSLKGKIEDEEKNPISFVNVALYQTAEPIGTSSDVEGFFEIKTLTKGNYLLKISAIGYKSLEQKIELNADIDLGIIRLSEDLLGLQEVVVSGTMKESFVSESPVKINVYTAKMLEQTIAPTNLMESLRLINGVQEISACGVCNTNSISINGLPGAYTAILIDGTPAYGNLASVYGLNGIPSNVVDRIEVIKGPNSTLYGSEALAGVVNVITKNPEQQPLISLDLMGTSDLEAFTNLSFAVRAGKTDLLLGLQHAYSNYFEDFNKDGFGDNLGLDRLSAFGKISLRRPSGKRFHNFVKFLYEDRRNGVEEYMRGRVYRQLRGSNTHYGESIFTRRLEWMGSYELPTKAALRLDYSFSTHRQNSYYGSDFYAAQQYIGYVNGIWNRSIGKHDLMAGATLRYQFYDDNTIATQDSLGNNPENQWIPGLWIQDEWRISPKKLTLLPGMRLDYFKAHGLIPSPRLSLKYKPSTWWTLRLNIGTGFRVVNLFAEDHAFVSGNRRLVLEEKLRPERSYSGTFNLNYIFSLGKGQGSFDADIFYTYFMNAIFPDYTQPDAIIYRNLRGNAQTRGLAFALNYSFDFPLQLNLGTTLQQAFQTNTDVVGVQARKDLLFAPAWSGIITLTYNWRKAKLFFAYTANLSGPMPLPEIYDLGIDGLPLPEPRPLRSKPFSVHNIQCSKTLEKQNITFYLGLQNIFNYRQVYSPLSGYNDPNTAVGFSPYFDTSYSYSSLHGRELYLGLRWKFGKK